MSRGFFCQLFDSLAPWHRAFACDCRITTASPVARLALPLLLLRFVRFQGEGPILYIVFLALDFSFFYVRLGFFCRCLCFPSQVQTRRPRGAASMTGFTPALLHPMSRSSGPGGWQMMGFTTLPAAQTHNIWDGIAPAAQDNEVSASLQAIFLCVFCGKNVN